MMFIVGRTIGVTLAGILEDPGGGSRTLVAGKGEGSGVGSGYPSYSGGLPIELGPFL